MSLVRASSQRLARAPVRAGLVRRAGMVRSGVRTFTTDKLSDILASATPAAEDKKSPKDEALEAIAAQNAPSSDVSVPLGAMVEELGATKEEWEEKWDGDDALIAAREKEKTQKMSTTKKKKMRHAWKWMLQSYAEQKPEFEAWEKEMDNFVNNLTEEERKKLIQDEDDFLWAIGTDMDNDVFPKIPELPFFVEYERQYTMMEIVDMPSPFEETTLEWCNYVKARIQVKDMGLDEFEEGVLKELVDEKWHEDGGGKGDHDHHRLAGDIYSLEELYDPDGPMINPKGPSFTMPKPYEGGPMIKIVSRNMPNREMNYEECKRVIWEIYNETKRLAKELREKPEYYAEEVEKPTTPVENMAEDWRAPRPLYPKTRFTRA